MSFINSSIPGKMFASSLLAFGTKRAEPMWDTACFEDIPVVGNSYKGGARLHFMLVHGWQNLLA